MTGPADAAKPAHMTWKARNLSLLGIACVALAACGEPADTAQAPEPEGPVAEATPAPEPTLATEPPVSRQPDIPPPSAHIALNPGIYRAEDIELSLSALRFELAMPAENVAAEGTYEVINGVLSLSATTGETGRIAFPLECRLSRAGPTIGFDDAADGSCGGLAGLRFQRETRPN